MFKEKLPKHTCVEVEEIFKKFKNKSEVKRNFKKFEKF